MKCYHKFKLLFAFEECGISLIGHVGISLACNLKGRMHRKKRSAAVYDLHAKDGQKLGNRAAAALIYLAQFAGLPDDPVFVEELSDLGQVFGIGIA